jgi:glycosyltransferase involved in cell wall biosynthesis
LSLIASTKQQLVRVKPLTRGAQAWGLQAADRAGLLEKRPPVGIVIEKADWAIRWYGTFTAEAANAVRPDTAWVTTEPARVTRGLVEFGSQYQWVDWSRLVSPRCRTVSTFFHGKPDDGDAVARHIERFMAALPRLDRVICSASIVRDRLIGWGAPKDKLALIPIGCETGRFVPPTPEQRRAARERFHIPAEAIVVGSFQKDGEGWGDGDVPKLIKGPDIFLAAIEKMKRDHKIFVMVTGPARGYVKQGLARMGVPFAHHYAADRDDLARVYHALDLYLVTSREEGGPMGLMESMASHVPVVSTRVGMAPDLIADGVTGFMVDGPDAAAIAACASQVIALRDGGAALKAAAREAVMVTDWSVVGRRQLAEVWQPLLSELG